MALELSDVKRIAHLARIEVSDGEAAQTLTQLNQFFSLVEQMQAAGRQHVVWNGRDETGRGVGAGVYFVQMHAGQATWTRKLIVLN